MREDTQEYLDKMFPDGWCLVYIQKNRDFRFSHHAPDEGAKEVIAPFWGLAKRVVRSRLFGYFEHGFEAEPTHDPGLDVDCLFCLKRLSAPLKTISLMKDGDKRSFFYRSHKDCYEGASAEEITEYESQLMDGIEP